MTLAKPLINTATKIFLRSACCSSLLPKHNFVAQQTNLNMSGTGSQPALVYLCTAYKVLEQPELVEEVTFNYFLFNYFLC